MSTRLKETVSYNRHEEGLQVLCRLIRSKKVRVSFFQTVIQMLMDVMFTVYQILSFLFQSRMSGYPKESAYILSPMIRYISCFADLILEINVMLDGLI